MFYILIVVLVVLITKFNYHDYWSIRLLSMISNHIPIILMTHTNNTNNTLILDPYGYLLVSVNSYHDLP